MNRYYFVYKFMQLSFEFEEKEKKCVVRENESVEKFMRMRIDDTTCHLKIPRC